jgi:hypothetical protein
MARENTMPVRFCVRTLTRSHSPHFTCADIVLTMRKLLALGLSLAFFWGGAFVIRYGQEIPESCFDAHSESTGTPAAVQVQATYSIVNQLPVKFRNPADANMSAPWLDVVAR